MKKFAFLFSFVLFLDVLSKVLVRKMLPLGAEISVAPFFSLVHVTNTGVAFGLFQGHNFRLAAVGLVFSSVLVIMAYRARQADPFFTAVLGLVLAGALGNLIDRVAFGHVTDFLDFHVQTHHWPAFNVADSAICIGAALLIWDQFKNKKNLIPPPLGEDSGGGIKK